MIDSKTEVYINILKVYRYVNSNSDHTRASLRHAVNIDRIFILIALSINIVARPKKEDSCDSFHFVL